MVRISELEIRDQFEVLVLLLNFLNPRWPNSQNQMYKSAATFQTSPSTVTIEEQIATNTPSKSPLYIDIDSNAIFNSWNSAPYPTYFHPLSTTYTAEEINSPCHKVASPVIPKTPKTFTDDFDQGYHQSTMTRANQPSTPPESISDVCTPPYNHDGFEVTNISPQNIQNILNQINVCINNTEHGNEGKQVGKQEGGKVLKRNKRLQLPPTPARQTCRKIRRIISTPTLPWKIHEETGPMASQNIIPPSAMEYFNLCSLSDITKAISYQPPRQSASREGNNRDFGRNIVGDDEGYVEGGLNGVDKATPYTNTNSKKHKLRSTRTWDCLVAGCHKEFKSGAGLRYHLSRTHNTVTPRARNIKNKLRPWECENSNCDKTFCTKAGLRYHSRTFDHDEVV